MNLPNGQVRVDRFLRNELLDKRLVHIEDAAHDEEHGVETQLPFVARFFRASHVLPLVVGQTDLGALVKLIDALAAGRYGKTLFVISTDLSHFHTQDQGNALDIETAKMIETSEISGLDAVHACGWRPLMGFLASELAGRCQAIRLDMGDSASANKRTDRVVGYGAWAFYPSEKPVFGSSAQKTMLRVARRSIALHLKNGKAPEIDCASFAAPLQTQMASFVTLKRDGQLAGCIGSLRPHQPLIRDISENAIKAALHDPRFQPLQNASDLDGMDLKIALLSRPRPISFMDRNDLLGQLQPSKTGLTLWDGQKRATFLPMVWEDLPDPESFLQRLLVKAGLPADYWSPSLRAQVFHAESFSNEWAWQAA